MPNILGLFTYEAWRSVVCISVAIPMKDISMFQKQRNVKAYWSVYTPYNPKSYNKKHQGGRQTFPLKMVLSSCYCTVLNEMPETFYKVLIFCNLFQASELVAKYKKEENICQYCISQPAVTTVSITTVCLINPSTTKVASNIHNCCFAFIRVFDFSKHAIAFKCNMKLKVSNFCVIIFSLNLDSVKLCQS